MEETYMKITKEQLKAIMPNSRRMLFGYLCHQGMPFCIVVLSCGSNRIVGQKRWLLWVEVGCLLSVFVAVLSTLLY